MNADEVFARYSINIELDKAELGRLRAAILSPSSVALREILQAALVVDKRDFSHTSEYKTLRQAGLEADEACFRSEAFERMVLCNTIGDRLNGISDVGTAMYRLAYSCEKAARGPRMGKVDWNPPAVERLVRARVHAAETNGASNSINHMGDGFDPIPHLADAPALDAEARARYAFQLGRLEAAERVSHRNERGSPYFKPADVPLLATLAEVSNRRSVVYDQIEAGREIAFTERRRLVEQQSSVWRDLFDALFELRPAIGTNRDSHEQAVLNLPAFEKLSSLGTQARGIALTEASAMVTFIEALRSGKVALPSNPPIDDGIGGLGHPYFYLPALVALLLEAGAVDCGDAAMASLIDRATNWRPLCRPELLDSAERTLRFGPAAATIAALRRMAVRPSHCFVPSRSSGDFEGDGWWQDTPGRIAHLLAGRPDPGAPRSLAGRPIFGRRRA